jgi:hypothetical protein
MTEVKRAARCNKMSICQTRELSMSVHKHMHVFVAECLLRLTVTTHRPFSILLKDNMLRQNASVRQVMVTGNLFQTACANTRRAAHRIHSSVSYALCSKADRICNLHLFCSTQLHTAHWKAAYLQEPDSKKRGKLKHCEFNNCDSPQAAHLYTNVCQDNKFKHSHKRV